MASLPLDLATLFRLLLLLLLLPLPVLLLPELLLLVLLPLLLPVLLLMAVLPLLELGAVLLIFLVIVGELQEQNKHGSIRTCTWWKFRRYMYVKIPLICVKIPSIYVINPSKYVKCWSIYVKISSAYTGTLAAAPEMPPMMNKHRAPCPCQELTPAKRPTAVTVHVHNEYPTHPTTPKLYVAARPWTDYKLH